MRLPAFRLHGQYRISFVLALFMVLFDLPETHAQVEIPVSTSRTTRKLPTNFNNRQSSKVPQHTSDSTHSDSTVVQGLEYHKEIPDSVLRQKVFFFNYAPISVKIDQVWNPTLDPTGVHYSDPLEGFNGDYYLGTGVIGHPHLSLYPTLVGDLTLQLQDDEHIGYVKTPDNIRFYQTLTPYTLLSYNNSLKKDYLVHVAHTQNIVPGWNFSFDYRLICPEGVFANSGAKNHYLDATTNYFSPDSRLQAQVGFIWQSFDIGENGGLTDDSYFTENQMTNQGGLPVRYSNAMASHLRHNLFGRVTYNLVRQVTDTTEYGDTLFASKPHVLNFGVVGVEACYYRRKRAVYMSTFSDSTLWSDFSATLFWTNDAYPDYRWHNPLKLTLGIKPQRIKAIVTFDTIAGPDTVVSSAGVNPFAKMELALGPTILRAEGELKNTLLELHSSIKDPDYLGRVSFNLPFDSTKFCGLEVSATIQRRMPDIRMLLLTNYNLQPIRSQRFTAHIYHNRNKGLLRLADLNVSATHLDHTVLYDSTLTPQISNGDIWLAQATATLQLQIGWFHLDMQQFLQHSSDVAQIAVPLWASKNSIYADFHLFQKALRMQIGFDVRYHTFFAPGGYDPTTGLFHHQDLELGNYWWGDAFINLQVKRASIYLKAGHINSLWEKYPRYFLLPHYPGQRFALLWGMTWNFFD